tara:strand:+ start:101 stop:517 length:417 start_codon:yes stop_codon:yes gene_type:complete
MTIEKERELGTCTSCKARGRIWSSKTADAYPYDTEKLCKKCSQPKILTKAFDMAWSIVKENSCCDSPRLIERQDGSTRCRNCQQSKVSKEEKYPCATHNCEDYSAKKDWSYCGKNDCSSCGDTCEDANCRKCNPDEKW